MIKAKASPKKSATKKASPKKVEVKKTAPKKAAVKKTVEPTTIVKTVAPKVASEKVVVTTKVETPKKVTVTSKVTAAPKATTTPKAAATKGRKIVTSNINGVGRRKSSVARVWLSKGNGDVVINGRTIESYFTTEATRLDAVKALVVCGLKDSYKIKVNVKGGGPCSQAGAVKLGVARALLKDNESLREILRKDGLLTVDARVKERKKPGQPGARRKFQFVKR